MIVSFVGWGLVLDGEVLKKLRKFRKWGLRLVEGGCIIEVMFKSEVN